MTIVSIRSVLSILLGLISVALKNANDMLETVVRAVDSNGDGVIQYEGK